VKEKFNYVSCHNTLAERKKHGYFEEADKIGLEADQIAVRGRD